MHPLTLVARAILPVHLAVAVPLVVLVAALVVVATLPGEETHTILLVIFVGTLIHVAVLVIESLLPLAFAMLEAIFELANVDTTILPFVLTLALWLTHVISARKAISVCKDVSALPMFQTALPFTFVPVPVLPLVHTVTGRFRLAPFADIGVTENAFPDSLALLQTKCPLALVHLTIRPGIDALSMGFPVEEFSLVSVSVRVALHTSAILGVVLPLALVDASLAVLHHA